MKKFYIEILKESIRIKVALLIIFVVVKLIIHFLPI